jgi:hypothetical protein
MAAYVSARASKWKSLCPCHPLSGVCGDGLQEPTSIEKVMEIDEQIGCAMSGLTADARTLIDHARAETQVRGAGLLYCS